MKEVPVSNIYVCEERELNYFTGTVMQLVMPDMIAVNGK